MAAAKLRDMHSTAHHSATSVEAEARQAYRFDVLLVHCDLCLHLPTVRNAEPRTSCAHQRLTTSRSIVPFWISVAIRQEMEVAVLGCQVSQLVLLNWPPAFSPPMLAQIYMGPEKERKKFCSRVNWPWQSPALSQDDQVTLIGISSPTTSLAKVASPEAVHAWWRPHRPVRQTLRLNWANCRPGFLQVLC